MRLLGVSITNLVSRTAQLALFEREQKKGALTTLMDAVNDRYGDFTLTWGSLLATSLSGGVIAPSWRPADGRNAAGDVSPDPYHTYPPPNTPQR